LLEQKIHDIINDIHCDLNIPVGIDRMNPLEVALSKGSAVLVKTLLQKGAEPTVSFKYETVDNFRKGIHSPLKYIVNQSYRSKDAKEEINQILEEYLLKRDKKVDQDKMSQANAFMLVEEFVVIPKIQPPKPTKHL